MADRATNHRRTHNILLLQRLLTLREGSSPFTLVLDSLDQSGKPLIEEYTWRAKAGKITVIFVAYEAMKAPFGVDAFIKASRKEIHALQREISVAIGKHAKSLLVFDTLNSLSNLPSLDLPTFLSSFISPHTSLLATYHLDIPLSSPRSSPYAPPPLTLLKYLATTIFTTHSLSHILAKKRAAEKSLPEPVFGLAEEVEGVIVGLGSNDPRGVVLEMEHRRKSGRGVEEWFFLPTPDLVSALATGSRDRGKEKVMLLDDHPLYRTPESVEKAGEAGDEGTTFSLGLTEKQRQDREGVVLPYFDAQREGGGEGGRILYDMGVEDDFDEEEDEI